jgi:hypothetical protein
MCKTPCRRLSSLPREITNQTNAAASAAAPHHWWLIFTIHKSSKFMNHPLKAILLRGLWAFISIDCIYQSGVSLRPSNIFGQSRKAAGHFIIDPESSFVPEFFMQYSVLHYDARHVCSAPFERSRRVPRLIDCSWQRGRLSSAETNLRYDALACYL